MREVSRDTLLAALQTKVGRWDHVWWNGELIGLGEALVRTSELPGTIRIMCARDEIVIPKDLDNQLNVA